LVLIWRERMRAKTKENDLTICEKEVIATVYELPENERSLKIICALVNKTFGHEWMPQTVSTFLHRIVEKGYLTWVRQGRVALYTPTYSNKEFRKELLKEVIDLMYKDKEDIKKDIEELF